MPRSTVEHLEWPTPSTLQEWQPFFGVPVLQSHTARNYVYTGRFRNGHPVFAAPSLFQFIDSTAPDLEIWRDSGWWHHSAQEDLGEPRVEPAEQEHDAAKDDAVAPRAVEIRARCVVGADPNLPPLSSWLKVTPLRRDPAVMTFELAITRHFAEALVQTQYWRPSIQTQLPPACRRFTVTVILCAQRIRADAAVSCEDGLPDLPIEMWLCILSQLSFKNLVQQGGE